MRFMENQMRLLEMVEEPEARRPSSWKLDEGTKETGRRGVAEARQILRQAAERQAQKDRHPTAA